MRNKSIYSFLLEVAKPYKWHYFIMLLTPCVAAFYAFANNYALKLIIDAFSNSEFLTYREFLFPILIFVSAQILLDVVWRISDLAEWHSQPYVRQNILLRTYEYIQQHSYRFFQNTSSGSITSKIKGILDGYDSFWANVHRDFTPHVADTIVGCAVLAVVNLKICVIVSIWALTFVVIMYHLSKKLDDLSVLNSDDRHKIFGVISDNITNIFTICSFATKKYESENVKKVIVNELNPSTIKVYKFSFFLNIVAALLYWTMLIGLFLIIIQLRRTNQISNGDIVFVMGMVLAISMELWEIIHKMQNFMRDLGDFKSSFEILCIPHDNLDLFDTPILIKNPSISFEKINFSHDNDNVVFKDLNLRIKSGEKVGIVGTSGAGKSTLISLLLKNFPISSGRILVDNQDISQISADSIREKVAVIPQDILLFHRSILENIRYGNLKASDEEVIEAAKMANIDHFIRTLPEQYNTLVGERGVKLSGGQRQRIAIARAILKNAPILILDEATSSLDTETEQLIQDSLNDIFGNKNITVLAIAHRLSTLKNMQRILVLEQGKVIEEGSHEELLSYDSCYKKLWNLQKI